MILVLKKKTVIICFIIILIAGLAAGTTAKIVKATHAQKDCVVVLDAGHGGRDNGVIGTKSGMKEKELNLIVTFLVKEELEKAGIKVVLTRKDDDALYGAALKNFKLEDMKKRKEIINATAPDAVVSIHMNRFPADSSRRGAQTFFEEMSDKSKALAQAVQAGLNTLNKEYAQREFAALKGDYYILKCNKYPSAIVECGFMSNPEEDMLLQQEDYRKKIAYLIASGIMGYLSMNTSFNSGNEVTAA
ncbi:MAG: N-acetylmuramoyl-L-alanine amidase [Clostridia bacterium]|nr:N-acetylmuramoyl-L-alanine amidase [Clostridia bacterium]